MKKKEKQELLNKLSQIERLIYEIKQAIEPEKKEKQNDKEKAAINEIIDTTMSEMMNQPCDGLLTEEEVNQLFKS